MSIRKLFIAAFLVCLLSADAIGQELERRKVKVVRVVRTQTVIIRGR